MCVWGHQASGYLFHKNICSGLATLPSGEDVLQLQVMLKGMFRISDVLCLAW